MSQNVQQTDNPVDPDFDALDTAVHLTAGAG